MKKKAASLIKIRKRWRINPKTRVVRSRKIYARKKIRKDLEIVLEDGEDET